MKTFFFQQNYKGGFEFTILRVDNSYHLVRSLGDDNAVVERFARKQ